MEEKVCPSCADPMDDHSFEEIVSCFKWHHKGLQQLQQQFKRHIEEISKFFERLEEISNPDRQRKPHKWITVYVPARAADNPGLGYGADLGDGPAAAKSA